jgi:antitoxin MazE
MMHAVVKKWGNSAALRIPASVMAAARVSLDQAVDIREEAGRIIIEPVRPNHHDLASLLAAITDDNRHEGVEFGAPRGREAW